MAVMTFAQFQATRVRSDDLGAALDDVTLAKLGPAKGFLYLSKPPNEQGYTGGLYIEEDLPGIWRLTIGDDEELTTDLGGLERRLYQFAIADGYIEPDRFSDALHALATAATAVHEAWDEARVPAGAYPRYLPPFDEFVLDLQAFRDAVAVTPSKAQGR
jgi:hypothetical protein